MSDYELGVIGAGNMAEAIVRGVIAGGFVGAGDIIASEPDEARREFLSAELGIACVEDNLLPAACPKILLAVKPQMMEQVLGEIASSIGDDALVISIAAGLTSSFFDELLGHRGKIVRVMPNTPMLVGAGVSAVSAGPRASDDDVEWTRRLFAATGQAIVVDEDMMDAVTAVSGSGPAYFFYLVEAMTAAGIAEGLSSDVALELARRTCEGAGRLMIDSGDDPAVLRKRVTSPGGTTQQAIETLDSAGVRESLVAAVRAAAERSRELGK